MEALLNLLITPRTNLHTEPWSTLKPTKIESNQKPTKVESNQIRSPRTLAKIFSTRAVWGWLLVVILLYAIGFVGMVIDDSIDDFLPCFSIDEFVLFGLIIGAVDGLMALALTLKSWVRVLVIALMLLFLHGAGIIVLIIFGFMNLTGGCYRRV